MTSTSPSAWHESDLQRWFVERPFLPDGEELVVASTQRPLGRIVDILCVDKTGVLSFSSSRTRLPLGRRSGRLLEYLAASVDTSMEDLADEYDGDLPAKLKETFGAVPAAVSKHRRAFVVAPAFDAPSVLATRFLTEQLRSSGIEMGLIRAAWPAPAQFELVSYEGPTFLRSRALPAGLAWSPRTGSSSCWSLATIRSYGMLASAKLGQPQSSSRPVRPPSRSHPQHRLGGGGRRLQRLDLSPGVGVAPSDKAGSASESARSVPPAL